VADGGQQFNPDGTATLKVLDLVEVSVVAVPANPRARLTGVKSITSQTDLERLLRDAGLARGAALKLAAGGWPALTNEPPETPEVEELVTRFKAATLELQKLKG
jgi:hypothetical protein